MASLTWRRNRWYITYRNSDGSVRHKSTNCKEDERDKADDMLAAFKDEQRLDRIDPFAKHRRTALDKHIHDYYREQRTEVTRKQARSVRRRLRIIIRLTKIKRLDDLTEGKVKIAVAKIRKHSSRKLKEGEQKPIMPKLSLRSRNIYRAAIRSFTRWMMKERRIAFDPLFGMKDEDESEDVRHPRTALTDEQFALLYQTALGSTKTIEGIDGVTRARAYLLSVVTGLRRKELGSLTRTSFRFDKNNPRVILHAKFAKDKKAAKIKLPHYVLVELRKWLASVKDDGPLLPHFAKKKTFKMIRRDLETAGITYQDDDGNFRDWHALRHTYITRAWRSGASAATVQKLARHADIRQTMGYSHTGEWDEREAVDKTPPLRLAPDEGQEGVA